MQRRLAILLFIPSIFSGTSVFAITIGVLGWGAWTYINDNQLFYGSFSGAYSLQSYVWDISFRFSSITNAFLHSPASYYVLVGGMAIAAGVAVFTVLQLVRVVLKQSHVALHAAQNPSDYHLQYLRDTVSRLWLRVLSIVGWALYSAFFVSTFIPFVLLLLQVGVEDIQRILISGWLECAGSAGLLMLGLHMHIIFMRLVALRPRLFGSDAIEAAEAISDHEEISLQ
jgi:hypothetical protein